MTDHSGAADNNPPVQARSRAIQMRYPDVPDWAEVDDEVLVALVEDFEWEPSCATSAILELGLRGTTRFQALAQWLLAHPAADPWLKAAAADALDLQGPPSPPPFATLALPADPTVTAPDGSDVRVLLALAGGSMAHFALAPGRCSAAVRHKTVDELWYVLSGQAQMWRRQDGHEEVVTLQPGTSLSIPVSTSFQFRSTGAVAFAAVGVTLPPWPGPDEAEAVPGPWQAA